MNMLILPPQVTSSRGYPVFLLCLPASRWWSSTVGSKGYFRILIPFSSRIGRRKPWRDGHMGITLSWGLLSIMFVCMILDIIFILKYFILFLLKAAARHFLVSPTRLFEWICIFGWWNAEQLGIKYFTRLCVEELTNFGAASRRGRRCLFVGDGPVARQRQVSEFRSPWVARYWDVRNY